MNDTAHRIGRCLTQAANRGVNHHGAQIFQRRQVPVLGFHQLRGLAGTDPARGALATAFVGKKAHHVVRRIARPVVLAQHDHGRRADETAIRLQGVKVERHMRQTGRKNAARRAARQIGVELVALRHAAAIFGHQFIQ